MGGPFDLSGKTALVTGAGSGLGFAMAQGLAEAGARVVLNGRNVAKLETAAAALIALDNVVLTPHVGSATWQTRRAMADRAFGNLEAHFAGKPLLSPVP